MEEAPENGKGSLHSTHANGMNERIFYMPVEVSNTPEDQ
jgi:hypothetical protein